MTETATKPPAKPLRSGSKVAGFEDNQISTRCVMDTETGNNSVKYTDQQIEECIKEAVQLNKASYSLVLDDAVQIIRQLQGYRTEQELKDMGFRRRKTGY